MSVRSGPIPQEIRALSSPAIKNVLIATDFSQCAENAISTAAGVARRFGAAVHILHVLGREPRTAHPTATSTLQRQCEEALDRLRFLSRSEAFQHIVCHLIAQPGAVADVTAKLVDELGIDLVVLGTHGRRGLEHLVVGSAAQEIMRRANCAVMTVGPHVYERGIATGAIGSIVYATDFSTGSLRALEYAVAFARANCSRIIAFHAIPVPNAAIDSIMDMNEENRRVKEQLRQLVPSDINYEVAVCHGPAADMILDIAGKQRTDLIVMGAHAGGPASAHLPWATAHQVVSGAECPVLTVRAR
jgi:nucleotide-binding universal stress UspA family protein